MVNFSDPILTYGFIIFMTYEQICSKLQLPILRTHASGYVVHIQLITRRFAAIFLLLFAHIMPSN